MQPVDLVCLCTQYDLKAMFGRGFAAYPWIRLKVPDEVEAPETVRFALAFRPGLRDFDRYPALELVCGAGAGVDGLLGHPGLPRGVGLTRLLDPDQARMTAGFALWYVIGHQRRMWDYAVQQKAEHWQVINHREAAGCPVAILGFGAMGRALAAPLRALGFPVRAWAGRAREEAGVRVETGAAGLAAVLGEAEAVVNLLPLTPATEGILSAERFAEMKPGSMLIHLGRGGHLIEEDLLEALAAGRPGHAAVDVTATEPLPGGHAFWRHPQIMLTPHAASESSPENGAGLIAGALRAYLAGERPPGWVDRDRGY